MTSVDMIKNLYAYNHWANQRILETAKQLNTAQFFADVGASFPSVRDTLVHTLHVQNNWLHRWQKEPLPPGMEFSDFPDLDAIITTWARVDDETDHFLELLTEPALNEVIEYVNSAGKRISFTLWQMMLHQVNHATQHRSEVAVMLTQFGYSPGWLDYVVFLNLDET